MVVVVAVVLVTSLGSGASGPGHGASRHHTKPQVVNHLRLPSFSPVLTGPSVNLVAEVRVPHLAIYPAPGAASPTSSLANPNPLGAPLVLLVASERGTWVQVYLPVRPNETTGWVPQRLVALKVDPFHIKVELGARRLLLQQDGATVLTAPVAVGAPGSPTPTGHFFVTEVLKLTDPGDAYGPFALGLSGFSNTYYSFDGGPGQIAIHGTDQPWVIGGYASHGCVRLDNSTMARLAAKVPAGTPVDIVP